jgi:hypothetical protein
MTLNEGTMRFARADDVLRELDRRYALVRANEAEGRKESVTIEVLDLTSRP